MTYYLDRYTRTMGTETLTIRADTWQEAVKLAKRLHEPRTPASGATLWDHGHRAVATLGPSDDGLGQTKMKIKKLNENKSLYYGNLYNYMDDYER